MPTRDRRCVTFSSGPLQSLALPAGRPGPRQLPPPCWRRPPACRPSAPQPLQNSRHSSSSRRRAVQRACCAARARLAARKGWRRRTRRWRLPPCRRWVGPGRQPALGFRSSACAAAAAAAAVAVAAASHQRAVSSGHTLGLAPLCRPATQPPATVLPQAWNVFESLMRQVPASQVGAGVAAPAVGGAGV